MSQLFAVEHAGPKELALALRLVFQNLPEPERAARVANALTLICQDELDPLGILVVRRKAALLGAIVSMRLPGGSGLLWPPQVSAKPQAIQCGIEDQLVQAALGWVKQGGAKVAQALVRLDEANLVAPLVRHGFVHITNLWYLRHNLAWATPQDDPGTILATFGNDLVFQPESQCARSMFERTLLRTYEGTMDCPELNGVRSLEEIIQGHQHQARHDPPLWWLVLEKGQSVGVILLGVVPEWDALDIAYLGVVPEARGRRLGRALAARTLKEAKAQQVSQVTLAVDARNRPARNIYGALGFQPQEEREVYLYIWGQ